MNYEQQLEVGGFNRPVQNEDVYSDDGQVLLPGGFDENQHAVDERVLEAKTPEIIPPKKSKKQYTLKAEDLVEKPCALPSLFRQFTIDPKTIGSLRGKGHEASDLRQLDRIFRGWHLNVNPRNEYYYFLEKVRKLGREPEVTKYLKQLRDHYKGVELLEEFAQDVEQMNQQAATSHNPAILAAGGEAASRPKPDPNRRVRFQLDNASSHPPSAERQQSPQGNTEIQLGLEPAQPEQPPLQNPYQMTLTPEQQERIEQNRLRALEKKRKRQEMESQLKLQQDELDRNDNDIINDMEKELTGEEEEVQNLEDNQEDDSVMIVEGPAENPEYQDGVQKRKQHSAADQGARDKIVREEDDDDLIEMNVNELEDLMQEDDDMVDLSDAAINDIIGAQASQDCINFNTKLGDDYEDGEDEYQ